MKLERLTHYSGEKCSVYTVVDDAGKPKYYQFIEGLKAKFENSLMNLAGRIKSIGHETGLLDGFIKKDEGLNVDDNVCALYDVPGVKLRLYCIAFSEKILILGSGGCKTTRTWQSDPLLTREVELMMRVSEILKQKIKNGDIKVSTDGLKLTGNLNLP